MTKPNAPRVRSVFAQSATTLPEPTTVPVPPTTATGDSSPSTSMVAEEGGELDPNTGLTAGDSALLAAAVRRERALEALYTSVADREPMATLALAHEAYATRLAGIAGISSTEADAEFYSQFEAGFAADEAVAATQAEVASVDAYLEALPTAQNARVVSAFAAVAMGQARITGLVALDADAEMIQAGNQEATTETTEAQS